MTKSIFVVSVWDIAEDLESLNNLLEEFLIRCDPKSLEEWSPSDISYKFKSITEDGMVTIEATYDRYFFDLDPNRQTLPKLPKKENM